MQVGKRQRAPLRAGLFLCALRAAGSMPESGDITHILYSAGVATNSLCDILVKVADNRCPQLQ